MADWPIQFHYFNVGGILFISYRLFRLLTAP
jgi:hypothetical protein